MSETKSFCRLCYKACPVQCRVEEGRLIEVRGDRSNVVYDGYTCVKGRAAPEILNHPDRLLGPLRRLPSGSFEPVDLDEAIGDIAERIRGAITEFGPRSVASYLGTQVGGNTTTLPIAASFMRAIGSPMSFSPNTIDKPGRSIAWQLLGRWMAPHHNFHDPDVAFLLGINPYVNGIGGVPFEHPGRWIADARRRGMRLIVVDPRRSDVAKRADIFLQPRPGNDVAILAAMLHVIITEGLHDREFVDSEVTGFGDLAQAVDRFDVEHVARAAGIDPDDLRLAARTFATAGRGYVVAGTGPHMANRGTLLEYLALCLDTICGHWMRAGDIVPSPRVLAAPTQPRAQVAPRRPAHGFGERSRVRDLGMTVAGMPSATLADEILTAGEGQVRVLISCGGNPAAAFPNQARIVDALQQLDLLVQIDPWMSHTSELAHYVIPPTMCFEVPGVTQKQEGIVGNYATGYGFAGPYAHYTEAIATSPSDKLVDDWVLFFRLAQRLGLQLDVESASFERLPLDMSREPSTRELLELMCRGSRVPLGEVAEHDGGGLFPPERQVVVESKEEGCEERLDVGNALMLGWLRSTAVCADSSGGFPFRLVCRRMMHVVNSAFNLDATNRGRANNPAFLHPDDLAGLSLGAGDLVTISSSVASIPAVVMPDIDVRRGVVSMSAGFGRGPERDGEVRSIGSNPSRLIDEASDFDAISGQPRMSGIAVRIEPRRDSDDPVLDQARSIGRGQPE